MNKNLLSLYGLKWNPFSPELPIEALLQTKKIEHFFWRIENSHVREGGFALITGDPGTGKSAALRRLAERLGRFVRIEGYAHLRLLFVRQEQIFHVPVERLETGLVQPRPQRRGDVGRQKRPSFDHEHAQASLDRVQGRKAPGQIPADHHDVIRATRRLGTSLVSVQQPAPAGVYQRRSRHAGLQEFPTIHLWPPLQSLEQTRQNLAHQYGPYRHADSRR